MKLLIICDPAGTASLTALKNGWAPEDIWVWDNDPRHLYNVKQISAKINVITDIDTQLKEYFYMYKFIGIGNPPYGNAGRLAVKIVNKLAEKGLCEKMNFVMPRSIRKASLQNSLDRHIHIDKDVTNDDMLFGRKIKTVVQNYVIKNELRPLIPEPKEHKDFVFLKKGDSDVNVFIMRSGYAGKVMTDGFEEYEHSHYFMHAKSQQVIDNLKAISDELIEIGEETTGMNKVSKGEIISTYSNYYGS